MAFKPMHEKQGRNVSQKRKEENFKWHVWKTGHRNGKISGKYGRKVSWSPVNMTVKPVIRHSNIRTAEKGFDTLIKTACIYYRLFNSFYYYFPDWAQKAFCFAWKFNLIIINLF